MDVVGVVHLALAALSLAATCSYGQAAFSSEVTKPSPTVVSFCEASSLSVSADSMYLETAGIPVYRDAYYCKCSLTYRGIEKLDKFELGLDSSATPGCGRWIEVSRGSEMRAYRFECEGQGILLESITPGETFDIVLHITDSSVSVPNVYGLQIKPNPSPAGLGVRCDAPVLVSPVTSTTSTSSTVSSTASSSPGSSSTTTAPLSSSSSTTGPPAVSNTEKYQTRDLVISAVLGAVGGAIAVAIIIVIVIIVVRKRRRRRRPAAEERPAGANTNEYTDTTQAPPHGTYDHIYSRISGLYDSIKSRYDHVSQLVSFRRGRGEGPSKYGKDKNQVTMHSIPDVIMESEGMSKIGGKSGCYRLNSNSSNESDAYLHATSQDGRQASVDDGYVECDPKSVKDQEYFSNSTGTYRKLDRESQKVEGQPKVTQSPSITTSERDPYLSQVAEAGDPTTDCGDSDMYMQMSGQHGQRRGEHPLAGRSQPQDIPDTTEAVDGSQDSAYIQMSGQSMREGGISLVTEEPSSADLETANYPQDNVYIQMSGQSTDGDSDDYMYLEPTSNAGDYVQPTVGSDDYLQPVAKGNSGPRVEEGADNDDYLEPVTKGDIGAGV